MIKQEEAPKGFFPFGKLGVLLILVISLSPFVVAFWIMGIITPKDAKDWVVFISYAIVLVATIYILSLYLYARLTHKKC